MSFTRIVAYWLLIIAFWWSLNTSTIDDGAWFMVGTAAVLALLSLKEK